MRLNGHYVITTTQLRPAVVASILTLCSRRPRRCSVCIEKSEGSVSMDSLNVYSSVQCDQHFHPRNTRIRECLGPQHSLTVSRVFEHTRMQIEQHSISGNFLKRGSGALRQQQQCNNTVLFSRCPQRTQGQSKGVVKGHEPLEGRGAFSNLNFFLFFQAMVQNREAKYMFVVPGSGGLGPSPHPWIRPWHPKAQSIA